MRNPKTVHDVIALYLPQARQELGDQTYKDRVRTLATFDAECGHLKLAKVRAFDLQNFLNRHREYHNGWTMAGVIGAVKRAFNWARQMELISRNPFEFIKKGKGRRRRPWTDDEYRSLMRSAPAYFRRFLVFLAFSGCRPGEASLMKWRHVRFEDNAVVLDENEHKTGRKTGRKRVIPLTTATLKLLRWLKIHRQVSVVELIERVLGDGPVKVSDFAKCMALYGIGRAKETLREMGVVKRCVRVVGHPHKTFWTYSLPEKYRSPRDPANGEYVFLNYWGDPWNRNKLAQAMRRCRKRAGLSEDVKLYGARHRYGTRGVRNNVNLKLLSLAMGHSDSKMTEHYVDAAGLTSEVQQAAMRVAYGPDALGVPTPMPNQRIVAMPIIPPVEHIPSAIEFVARRYKPTPRKTKPRGLKDCQSEAFRLWRWALEESPALANATDQQVFAWLSDRPEARGKLPAGANTFALYLSHARIFYGCQKRRMRRRA